MLVELYQSNKKSDKLIITLSHFIVTFLLMFKFASHRTIACIVSTANEPLVGTLITIGDVTRNIAIRLQPRS